MISFTGIKKRISTKYIIVHCSATKEDQDIGVTEIDRWHRAKGWAGIGYHYVIRRDGAIEEGRPQDLIGAHCEGFNSESVGVCMVGGVNADDINLAEDNFTDEQYESLADLLQALFEEYPKASLMGHRDMPNVPKACPSFDVRKWYSDLLSM